MRGLLTLLLYAAFFYLMMRFGCGAHMVHGHSGHGGHKDEPAGGIGGPSVDPVCGMEVQPGSGYTKMQNGRPYRFCSRDCLDRFEAAPEKYPS